MHKIKKQILLKIQGSGMGDTLAASAILRKISQIYNSKILVKSCYPDLFKNNPHVAFHFHLNEYIDERNYEVFTCYKGLENSKYHACLTARSCAYDLGFELLKNELTLDFYPDKTCIYDFRALKNYICLHTTSNWKNRTWKPEYWQKLVNFLQETDLNIVVTGKDYREIFYNGSSCEKKCFVPNGSKVINLTNDNSSISDLWYLINNACAIVTMDSGPLHLAGTTDTWIFQIGSARHPELTNPYRNGSQEYKHEFIGGECQLFCASNMKYSVKEWGTINSTHFLPECQENYLELKCHPTPEQVYKRIKDKLKI